jgi:hypothetical protein
MGVMSTESAAQRYDEDKKQIKGVSVTRYKKKLKIPWMLYRVLEKQTM